MVFSACVNIFLPRAHVCAQKLFNKICIITDKKAHSGLLNIQRETIHLTHFFGKFFSAFPHDAALLFALGRIALEIRMQLLGEAPVDGAQADLPQLFVPTDPLVCSTCRFPVSRLLGLLAAGETREGILEAYPYLEAADFDEVLRYAVAP